MRRDCARSLNLILSVSIVKYEYVLSGAPWVRHLAMNSTSSIPNLRNLVPRFRRWRKCNITRFQAWGTLIKTVETNWPGLNSVVYEFSDPLPESIQSSTPYPILFSCETESSSLGIFLRRNGHICGCPNSIYFRRHDLSRRLNSAQAVEVNFRYSNRVWTCWSNLDVIEMSTFLRGVYRIIHSR